METCHINYLQHTVRRGAPTEECQVHTSDDVELNVHRGGSGVLLIWQVLLEVYSKLINIASIIPF